MLPNGLELHPPFPKDIGTMCGLGKGAARRLRPSAFILGQLGRQATAAFFSASPVGFSGMFGERLFHPVRLALGVRRTRPSR